MTYREFRDRQERSLRSFLDEVVRRRGSINKAAEELETNVGSLSRVCRRLGVQSPATTGRRQGT